MNNLTTFSGLASDTLARTCTLLIAVPLVIVFCVKWGSLKRWIADRKLPLFLIVGCYFIGVVAAVFSEEFVIKWFPNLLESDPGPIKIVSAPDLLSNLLTINALIGSAALAYLGLPVDRVEARLASITQQALLNSLINQDDFEDWYRNATDAEKKSPCARLVKGFLTPRNAMGGWLSMSSEEMPLLLGKDVWNQLSKFVEGHLDDGWVRVGVAGMGLAITLGLTCLTFRYLGLQDASFHPVEFAVIVVMFLMNFAVGILLFHLSLGSAANSDKITQAIQHEVDNLRPMIEKHLTKRREQKLEQGQAMATTIAAHRPKDGKKV